MTKQQMLGQLAAMKEYFDRSTRVLEEADSTFAPAEGMFTAAQQVAHVAQTVEWFIAGVLAADGFDMDFERLDREVRQVTSLAAARAWMERACAAAQAEVAARREEEWAQALPPGPIMGGLPKFVVFGALTDHTAHHRGALTVYSRLRGKVPPMPYMDM
ncbi:MAG TPA: DinB family protein [Bryobacteraceae bacterium]|nr:DinB family protein [Bryobacteraceae bacterium]